ncbi:MAG: hypothetical protein II563_08140 [Treponema sp.]|nr:hypothetical protein [Treponema sp.]MBQ5383985.1 hypothetical protein [Treponema sp.]
MKRFLVPVFAAAVLFMTVSCSQNKKGPLSYFRPALPESRGEDVFKGKTFLSEGSRLKFGDNGMISVSALYYGENEGEITDYYTGEYRFDSNEKKLWISPENLYVNGKLTRSLDEYVEERSLGIDEELSGMIESGSLKIDGKSKSNYKYIIQKSYESQGRALLESVVCYRYDISSDGLTLNLVELPPESARGMDMEGHDDQNAYQLNFYGNEIVFMETEPVAQESESSVLYYAFVEWNDDYTGFTGKVYSVPSGNGYGDGKGRKFTCRQEGKIKGSLDFYTEENDGFYFYTAEFNFTEMPKPLKALKKAVLADAMYNYTESYKLQ